MLRFTTKVAGPDTGAALVRAEGPSKTSGGRLTRFRGDGHSGRLLYLKRPSAGLQETHNKHPVARSVEGREAMSWIARSRGVPKPILSLLRLVRRLAGNRYVVHIERRRLLAETVSADPDL